MGQRHRQVFVACNAVGQQHADIRFIIDNEQSAVGTRLDLLTRQTSWG
jgi:hypothetical protein